MYCADCYWKLQKEYNIKKTCEDCGYFDEESCEKTGRALVPVKAGFNTYFAQAETCRDYSTEQKGKPAKNKEKVNEEQKEVAALVKKLSDKKQTLTYYCCHCGAPIKIGAKAPEIQDTCPRCKGDLEIVNLAKFIKQHQ
jgi:hypothetical protein